MRSKPSTQKKIGEQIGKELRAIYDVVLQEPIPDRFRVLVDRLGEELASAAPVCGPASRLAAPGRVPRAGARVPDIVRSLPRGVTRLERA
ncbi:MAG: NepR family anti-sigma factor [Methylocystis sp.]